MTSSSDVWGFRYLRNTWHRCLTPNYKAPSQREKSWSIQVMVKDEVHKQKRKCAEKKVERWVMIKPKSNEILKPRMKKISKRWPIISYAEEVGETKKYLPIIDPDKKVLKTLAKTMQRVKRDISTDSKDIFLTFTMKEKQHYNLIHIICLILSVYFKGHFNYLICHESGYWSSNFMVLWCLSCWTQ